MTVSQLIQSKEQLQLKEITELYDVGKVLGEGTYGKVHKVCCKQTNEKLALKKLLKSKIAFKDFKRELNYSYFLSAHPNVVTTYTVAFQSSDYWVMVQELVPAGDLLGAIIPGVGIGVEQTKRTMRQLASALSFMHSKMLCHRDVKPENILLMDKENWIVKLTDFGLTCKVDTLVRRSSGSTPYTPPEQCDLIKNEGFKAQTSTDSWQAGITLFCLLTGTFPWDVASALTDKAYANFKQWAQHKIPKPAARWSRFSNKLLKLYKKLLTADPEERGVISIINKYTEYDWLTSKTKESWDQASISVESGEANNHEAKHALQDKLSEYGVKTTVTKSGKAAMINDWLHRLNMDSSSKNPLPESYL